MPYLAFDLDALENCPNIASGCGLTTPEVSHGLLMLWRHCWREKTDRVTSGHIRAFFSGADIFEMLITFGHIEADETGWRVRGAGRYLRVSEAQSASGKAHSGNLQRGRKDLDSGKKSPAGLRLSSGSPSGSSPALTASSEQRTANSEQQSLAGKKPADPRHAPMVLRLVEVYREEMGGAVYAFTSRDAKSITQLLGMTDDDDEIAHRWSVALRASLNQYQTPKTQTLPNLVRDWNHYPAVRSAS